MSNLKRVKKSGKSRKDAQGFRFVQRVGAISEYTLLANDMRVLLLEDDTTPTATLMVTYHVGSRNEVLGTTGSTHILEHLMFKGSKNFNDKKGNRLDYLFDEIGARNNATTSPDRTNYYEILPSEHLPLAIAVEADRMRNATFDDKDLASEMTVVRNEFERGENDPTEALAKAVWGAAFLAHPYHHSTIGWKSDIEGSTAEKLRAFYDHFYWPNNATLSIIGNFDTSPILETVRLNFAKLPASSHEIRDVSVEEPFQEGERRTIVRRHEEKQAVEVAYKVRKALDPTSYPLLILTQVLGAEHTGRLYKALVDKGLARGVSSRWWPTKDTGLLEIVAMLTNGTKHEEVEQVIEKELAKIVRGGITKDECDRARATLRAMIAFARDGSYAVADGLNEALAIGDWTYYPTLQDKLALVQPKDVHDLAKSIFIESGRTVGWFVGE